MVSIGLLFSHYLCQGRLVFHKHRFLCGIWLLMSVSGPAHVHLVGGPLSRSLIQLFISSRCLQLMQPQSWLNVLAFGLVLQYLGIPNSDGVLIFVINFSMCCIKTMWLKVLWLSYSPLYMPFNKLWLLCFFLLCDIACYPVRQWNLQNWQVFFVFFLLICSLKKTIDYK